MLVGQMSVGQMLVRANVFSTRGRVAFFRPTNLMLLLLEEKEFFYEKRMLTDPML
jgi:hypothetical protein